LRGSVVRRFRAPLFILLMMMAMLLAKLAQHGEVEVSKADNAEITGPTTQ
jgi:hypothetical protein